MEWQGEKREGSGMCCFSALGCQWPVVQCDVMGSGHVSPCSTGSAAKHILSGEWVLLRDVPIRHPNGITTWGISFYKSWGSTPSIFLTFMHLEVSPQILVRSILKISDLSGVTYPLMLQLLLVITWKTVCGRFGFMQDWDLSFLQSTFDSSEVTSDLQ